MLRRITKLGLQRLRRREVGPDRGLNQPVRYEYRVVGCHIRKEHIAGCTERLSAKTSIPRPNKTKTSPEKEFELMTQTSHFIEPPSQSCSVRGRPPTSNLFVTDANGLTSPIAGQTQCPDHRRFVYLCISVCGRFPPWLPKIRSQNALVEVASLLQFDRGLHEQYRPAVSIVITT